MSTFRKALLGLVVVLATSAQAQAHFLWLDLRSGDADKSQARLYFSEEPAPGEPHLIAKAAKTKVWLRGADGKLTPVSLAAAEGDEAALVAACNAAGASLEGHWDYGVFTHGPAPTLLNYYAKALGSDWTDSAATARAEKLKLDIVPALEGKKLAVQVLFDGQPVGDAEVQFVDPAGEHHDLKTDAEGKVSITAKPGAWAVRSAKIEADKSGERDGKKFDNTSHHATLTLDVPGTTLTAEKTPSAGESALDLLVRARDGRAMWNEFPGFTTDLTVLSGAETLKGKATIDADGVVTVDLPKGKLTDWVEEQLNSMVQHRMPDGEVSQGDVTFAEEANAHPLGRKIDLGDPSLQSAYRIREDAIMEVNRAAGPTMRFTISVLEIERNQENKYLPRSFTMNFFDTKSGDLRTSLAYFNSWQRVGAFDLPKQIIEIDAHKGGASAKQIDFSNCQLLAK